MAAISFEGYFETKSDGKIIEGDDLYLYYTKRIGVGYASSGSVPTGHYKYQVSRVERSQHGHVDSMVARLVTDVTKGSIFFEHVE